jgi:glycine oxidase
VLESIGKHEFLIECNQLSDAIVVGAGLIGMFCAREYVQSGLTVTLLERGQPGGESSWAGGGILSPLYPWRYPDAVTELARWSQLRYAALCGELEQATGIDPQYTHSGLLVLDDEYSKIKEWVDRFDVNVKLLVHSEITEIEPALTTEFDQAIWMPDVAQVRNPRFAAALRQDLENRGVDIRSQQTVTGFNIVGNKVTGVKTDQGLLHAGQTIVAAGAWSGELLKQTGFSLPVKPVRGQMVLFKAKPAQINRISLYRDHYVIPRRDGRVLAGSTLEQVGFDKRTTESALAILRDHAIQLIPELQNVDIEHHWAGLRPGSPNGIPYIGQHPSLEQLFINAGHFRNGVVLAPGSARLLADLSLGRETMLDPAPYLIE